MNRTILTLTTICLALATFGQWTNVTNYPTDVQDGAFAVTANGKAYIGGGLVNTNFYEYDPVADSYKKLTNVPSPGSSLGWAFAFAIDGNIYVCGGSFASATDLSDELWEYNIAADSWTQKADMLSGGRDGGFAFAIDGKGYIGGGFDGAYVKSEMYQYDPTNDSWTQKTSYSGGAIIFPSCFIIAGKAYVGLGADSMEKSVFYSYDPSNDQWMQRASFNGPLRQANFACSYKLKGYVFGGMNNYSSSFTDLWEYDSEHDYWLSNVSAAIPTANSAWGISFVIGNHIYAGLGVSMPSFNNDRKIYRYEISDPYLAIGENRKSKFEIFPNPATDRIYIQSPDLTSEKIEVILTNTTGQVVLRESLASQDGGIFDLSLSLHPGYYTMTIISGNEIRNTSFVVSY